MENTNNQAYITAFEAKVAERLATKIALNNEAKLALLDNEAFMDAQATLLAKSNDITALSTTIAQLNLIDPFVANDGTKYGIRVFPADSGTFGSGYSQLIGIIKGIDGAFTEDLAIQYSAITGIDTVELQEASLALGTITYCNKAGEVVDGLHANYDDLVPLLESIIMKLNMIELSASKVPASMVALWHTKAELKARNKSTAMLQAEKLGTESFVLED